MSVADPSFVPASRGRYADGITVAMGPPGGLKMNKVSAEKLIRGTIHERGNGLAGCGDYVLDIKTDTVYEVVEMVGGIHTGGPGGGNYIHVKLRDTGMSASNLTDEEYEGITCNVRFGRRIGQ